MDVDDILPGLLSTYFLIRQQERVFLTGYKVGDPFKCFGYIDMTDKVTPTEHMFWPSSGTVLAARGARGQNPEQCQYWPRAKVVTGAELLPELCQYCVPEPRQGCS